MKRIKSHLTTPSHQFSDKQYGHYFSAWLLLLAMGVVSQAEAVTPEPGFTRLDLPKDLSVLNPEICIDGYNLHTGYNPIAGISGNYGSEQILYNAMMMNPCNRPTSTATIMNSTSHQETARLTPYSTKFNYTASDVFWGVTDISDNFQHAIGSLDLFAAHDPKIRCRSPWLNFVDFFKRYPFPLAQYWNIGTGQPTGASKLYCPPKQFKDREDKGYFYEYCVPYVVSGDGLKVYGFEYTASAFVIWERAAPDKPFTSYNVPYLYQGTPYILGVSKDSSQILYRGINSYHEATTALLSLGSGEQDYTITELNQIPNTYGFDSDGSTVITEWQSDVVKLPLSHVQNPQSSTPLSYNTFSDFENQDWQFMPVQHLSSETLAGYPVRRHSGFKLTQNIDSVIWVPYRVGLELGRLVNALDYWQNHCHIKGIEDWALDNHMNSVFYARKQSNGMVSYYGYYRRADEPQLEPVLYRITVNHSECHSN